MHFPATWCQVPWKVLEKSEAKIEIFQAPNSAIVCTCVYDNCKLSPPNLSASASKTVVFNHLFHFYLSKCWMSVLWNSVPNSSWQYIGARLRKQGLALMGGVRECSKKRLWVREQLMEARSCSQFCCSHWNRKREIWHRETFHNILTVSISRLWTIL